MISVRAATSDDVDELVRLRRVMFAGMAGWEAKSGSWQARAADTFRDRLTDGTLAVFVVDAPEGGLAACAAGLIEQWMPGPANPTGRTGHVFNVSTDAAHRRLGYSRACMERLLDWYRMNEVGRVNLTASKDGEGLYASLGFVRTADPAMRLDL
jgi:GNAT superfamily N-acetyltransferase